MGVMWNSCGDAAASDTSVPGEWALMTPGQDIGDADHPTDTCGGKDEAKGEWDVYVRLSDIPTTPPSTEEPVESTEEPVESEVVSTAISFTLLYFEFFFCVLC